MCGSSWAGHADCVDANREKLVEGVTGTMFVPAAVKPRKEAQEGDVGGREWYRHRRHAVTKAYRQGWTL